MAGAVAGILFAALFAVSFAIIVTSVHDLQTDTGSWLDTDAARFSSRSG